MAQLKQFGMNMVTGTAVLVVVPALIAGTVLSANYCTPGEGIGSSDNWFALGGMCSYFPVREVGAFAYRRPSCPQILRKP